jgi:hypothetical protein
LLAGLLLAVLCVGVPRSSSAVQVVVEYQFVGVQPNPVRGLFGGAPVTGLDATVIAQMNTAQTALTTASPALVSVMLASQGGATLSFRNIPGFAPGVGFGYWYLYSAISNPGNCSRFTYPYSGPFPCPKSTNAIANLQPGGSFNLFFQHYTNTYSPDGFKTTFVTGTEVSRSVPEPSSGLGLLAGGLGLLVMARHRRRQPGAGVG